MDGSTNSAIRANSIFSDGGLGIRLVGNGNIQQPYPTITSATSDGSSTTVQGTLTASPNTSYTLDFFANTERNPSGFGEGEQYLGSIPVKTDSSGKASFTATFALGVDLGNFISATAT